jgi:hypothetical protein
MHAKELHFKLPNNANNILQSATCQDRKEIL